MCVCVIIINFIHIQSCIKVGLINSLVDLVGRGSLAGKVVCRQTGIRIGRMGRRTAEKGKSGKKWPHLVRKKHKYNSSSSYVLLFFLSMPPQFGRNRKSSAQIKQPDYAPERTETYRRKITIHLA